MIPSPKKVQTISPKRLNCSEDLGLGKGVPWKEAFPRRPFTASESRYMRTSYEARSKEFGFRIIWGPVLSFSTQKHHHHHHHQGCGHSKFIEFYNLPWGQDPVTRHHTTAQFWHIREAAEILKQKNNCKTFFDYLWSFH